MKTGEHLAYWRCGNCGWTDDPAALQPAQEAVVETAAVAETPLDSGA
ncbi:hypothetical protein ACFQE3_20335 [Deinococcus aquaticus]